MEKDEKEPKIIPAGPNDPFTHKDPEYIKNQIGAEGQLSGFVADKILSGEWKLI